MGGVVPGAGGFLNGGQCQHQLYLFLKDLFYSHRGGPKREPNHPSRGSGDVVLYPLYFPRCIPKYIWVIPLYLLNLAELPLGDGKPHSHLCL